MIDNFKLTQEDHDYLKETYNLVKDIPEDEWMKGDFSDGKGSCCIIGHDNRLRSDDPSNYDRNSLSDGRYRTSRLRKITNNICHHFFDTEASIASVNNYNQYKQPVNGFDNINTKQNVIAFLEESLEIPVE